MGPFNGRPQIGLGLDWAPLAALHFGGGAEASNLVVGGSYWPGPSSPTKSLGKRTTWKLKVDKGLFERGNRHLINPMNRFPKRQYKSLILENCIAN
jgi:hypothetical protein